MGLTVKLYTFAKKMNSTSVPDSGDEVATLNNVVLKTPCTRYNPVIELVNCPSCNYAWIAEFSRYYYITGYEYLNNSICRLTLEEDPLASFRTSILTTNCYILRSSKKSNANISDTFYPTETSKHYKYTSYNYIDSSVPGSYIIGIVGKGAGNSGTITGAVQYYMMSQESLKSLMDYLFTTDNFVEEISDEVVKTFFNPFQYVTKCMYFPFQTTTGGQEISLGWFSTGVEGKALLSAHYVKAQEGEVIAIPRPVEDNRFDYRNYSPYSVYRMYIPYIGWIDIDADLLRDDTNLNIRSIIDYPTGKLMVLIRGNESNRLITTLEGQACSEISIAQVAIGQETYQAGAGILGAGISALGEFINFANSEDPTRTRQQNVGKTLAGIGSGLASAGGQVSIKGNNGCISQRFFVTQVIFICEYYNIVSQDNSDFGQPFCESDAIANHSGGFIKALNPHFQNSVATPQEIAEIENALEGGCYIV